MEKSLFFGYLLMVMCVNLFGAIPNANLYRSGFARLKADRCAMTSVEDEREPLARCAYLFVNPAQSPDKKRLLIDLSTLYEARQILSTFVQENFITDLEKNVRYFRLRSDEHKGRVQIDLQTFDFQGWNDLFDGQRNVILVQEFDLEE